jgi:excisionase family DNA binding protein
MSTFEDLVRGIAREEARAVVEVALAERPTAEEWLSHSEAAALLGVSPGTLYNQGDRVPFHKAGLHRRYRRSELEAYLEGRS